MKFGDNLRNLRKSKKMSQEDLAEIMKVSRQSVSKWETSDAYPEMNHILELCKIFHCHINDLVNDSMIDIDSLDEEIKMSVVKFKKEKQRKMKLLSKIISTLSKIGKIVGIIAIPFVVVALLVSPWVIMKTEVTENEIGLKINSDKIIITEEKDKDIRISYKGNIVIADIDRNTLGMVEDMFQNHSKEMIVFYTEVAFLFLGVCLVFMISIFSHLQKLFENIYDGDTPFTIENINHIKKMAYELILFLILPTIGGIFFEILMQTDLNIDFGVIDFLEILFLFSMVYIFEYGYEIQLDSKGRMYDNE